MRLRLLSLPALCCLFSGCFKVGPKTEEDVYLRMSKDYDELSTLLLRITDESSAKERLPKVKQIGERLKLLKVSQDEFDRYGMTPQREELKKRYERTVATSARRVVNQYQRLRKLVPGAGEVANEVQSILQYMGVNPTSAAFKSNG